MGKIRGPSRAREVQKNFEEVTMPEIKVSTEDYATLVVDALRGALTGPDSTEKDCLFSIALNPSFIAKNVDRVSFVLQSNRNVSHPMVKTCGSLMNVPVEHVTFTSEGVFYFDVPRANLLKYLAPHIQVG